MLLVGRCSRRCLLAAVRCLLSAIFSVNRTMDIVCCMSFVVVLCVV